MQDDSNLKDGDEPEFQYYVQQSGIKSNWQHPSEAELVKSVNTLHTFTRRLIAEKSQMQNALLDTKSKLRFSRGWIWILTLAVGGSWALTIAMVKLWLMPILERVPR
jgi:hypothetical protein